MFTKKLLGTLALIAAAVVVPWSAAARGSERAVGSFSADKTGILAATPFASLRSPRPHRLQYRGRVRVGADGNGATAARFATTLAGVDVRYVLVLDADCNPTRCRPPVEQLDVNLNDALVLHATDVDTRARRGIALNTIGADQNQITVTAIGSPGAGARIHILAAQVERMRVLPHKPMVKRCPRLTALGCRPPHDCKGRTASAVS